MADPWGALTQRMGTLHGNLNEACEEFTTNFCALGEEAQELYSVCVILARRAGVSPERIAAWTMGDPRIPLTVACREKPAAVFMGPFQPTWALFLRDAQDMISAVREASRLE